MAKKLSFDKLPEAVEKILEILGSEESEHTLLPELVKEVRQLRYQYDNLERLLSPNRRTMDKQTVFRLLKLRPRQLSELEKDGVLLSHKEGNKTVYYEDDVMRCFANQPLWKNALEAVSKPEKNDSAETQTQGLEVHEQSTNIAGLRGRIDIKAACLIVDRNPGAIYQLIKTKVIPNHKEGRSVYFIAEELKDWAKTHPARKYTKKK